MLNRVNFKKTTTRTLLTVLFLSSLSTSTSASRMSFLIASFSLKIVLAFLPRCGLSVGFPFALLAAALLLECDFNFVSLSTWVSEARIPSSVLSLRWSRQESTSGWTLYFFSFIILFSSRTTSKDGAAVVSSRNTVTRDFRHRSDD
jgi:hypothetical protein